MAKFCEMCNAKLSLFRRSQTCKECEGNYDEWSRLASNIESIVNLSEEELTRLKKFGKSPLIKLYSKLYEIYEKDKELDENEISTLERIQNTFELTKDDVKYYDKVLPYVYVNFVRKEGRLPTTSVDIPLNLKKDEVIHFAAVTIQGELRSVKVGYQPGSRGVSIRIMKGVSYRVGSHRGHVIKEDQVVEVSTGTLVITNKRLLLIPHEGKKPASIAIDKILYYRCTENYLEIYKDGRQKGFFFKLLPGYIEIAGICLGELVNSQ